MNTYRCPDLAKLGRELIQAYRNLDDRTIFELSVGPEGDQNQVRAIHLAMAEHRSTCPLCHEREVEHGQMMETLDPLPIAYQ